MSGIVQWVSREVSITTIFCVVGCPPPPRYSRSLYQRYTVHERAFFVFSSQLFVNVLCLICTLHENLLKCNAEGAEKKAEKKREGRVVPGGEWISQISLL